MKICAPQNLGAFCLLSALSFSHSARSQEADALKTITIPQIQILQEQREKETDTQKKIASSLVALLNGRRGVKTEGLPELRASEVRVGTGDQVAVDLNGEFTSDLKTYIQENGGNITSMHPGQNSASAVMPLDKIEGLAARPDIIFVSPTPKMRLNSHYLVKGSGISKPKRVLPDNEGDIAHAADLARRVYHVGGGGIKVGVMSDSVRGLAAAKKMGSLNALTVIKGEDGILPPHSPYGSDEGEGTAMLEIVHRIAPNAQLFFATANYGPSHMADNIAKLVAAGCRIIVDDISYSNESPFQDGAISIAINAASAKGVMYFSSAANSGSEVHHTSGTWEGDFSKGRTVTISVEGKPTVGTLHVFSSGHEQNHLLADGEGDLNLFWNDPLKHASNEYDLFVVDKRGNVIFSADSTISGSQDPYQTLDLPSGDVAGYSLIVLQRPGAADRHLFVDTDRGRLEFSTGGATHGHNASGAANAFSVAAISALKATKPFVGGNNVFVEPFSSDGPRRIYYAADGSALTPGNLTSTGGQVLQKPDLTAADGVTTDVPGFAPFFGTSAAAPHAAAIAALILSYRPQMTPDDVRKALASSALKIETNGWNPLAGAGIAMPLSTLDSLKKPGLSTRTAN